MTEKFWSQVDIRSKGECWPWRGAMTARGYGRVMIGGIRRMAHCWALEFATGEKQGGRCALHSCDNPNCVNPHHLRWGSQLENIQDRVDRGRNGAAFGQANGSCKLTDMQVISIRNDGRFVRDIANDYGVSQSLISAIKCQKIWRHLDGMASVKDGKTSLPNVFAQPKKQERQVLKR